MVVLVLSAAAASTEVSTQPAAADAAVDRVRLEQRLAAVETLLEKSSAARQIEASGDTSARQKHEKAREIYRQARAAFRAAQYARASALLPEASVQMFEAVRSAAPGEVAEPKARSDFEARLDSVNSLHAAFRRVAGEKPGTAGVAETSRDVDNLIGDARRLAGEGKLDAGRAALDRAYLLAKAAVSSLRGGDTLVRSLHFATREEEYRYEVDRNDTHQMLIKVLLNGKTRTTEQQSVLAKALQLRNQADAAAAGADHAAGVRLLEESTRELIRAIRGAGVFIPG
ncbi:MAG: hypothetical protein HY848_12850 [Betaproteobacteria bacterium]|nr:hypothetical protein [Betaproteobacteria bacterium]